MNYASACSAMFKTVDLIVKTGFYIKKHPCGCLSYIDIKFI